jgi:hypothetical protein
MVNMLSMAIDVKNKHKNAKRKFTFKLLVTIIWTNSWNHIALQNIEMHIYII